MKLFLILIFCCSLSESLLSKKSTLIHVTPYKHSEALSLKTISLESLLTQTYGFENPFNQLATIVQTTLEITNELVVKANKTQKAPLLEVVGELTHSLDHLDEAVTGAITALSEGIFKEEALKHLITQCNINASIIMNDALPYIKKRPRATLTPQKKRFVFIDPSFLVTAGKWFLTSATSLWILYVLKKVYTHLTLPNTELVERTKRKQEAVYESLIETEAAFMRNAGHATALPQEIIHKQPSRKERIARFFGAHGYANKQAKKSKVQAQLTEDCSQLRRRYPESNAQITAWENALNEASATMRAHHSENY